MGCQSETPAKVHPLASRPACQRGTGKDCGASGETNPQSSEPLPLRCAGAGVLMVCRHDLGAPPEGLGRLAYLTSRKAVKGYTGKPDGSLCTPSKHQPGRGKKACAFTLGVTMEKAWT